MEIHTTNGKKVFIHAGKVAPEVFAEEHMYSVFSGASRFLCGAYREGLPFKAEFQAWLHNNAGKTFREAVGVGIGRNVNRIRTDIISRILMQ